MRRLMAKRFKGSYVIVMPLIVCGWYGGKNNMALGLLRFNSGASALSIPLAPRSEAEGAGDSEGAEACGAEAAEAAEAGAEACGAGAGGAEAAEAGAEACGAKDSNPEDPEASGPDFAFASAFAWRLQNKIPGLDAQPQRAPPRITTVHRPSLFVRGLSCSMIARTAALLETASD